MLRKRGLVTAGLCCCVSMLGWAQYSEAAPNPGKVTICHKADSVKYIQITVAARAVPAHLAHGDCVVDDGVPCTADSCDVALGCVHAPDNSLCDDGDACTTDTCDPSPAGPGCVYADILVCGDGLVCGSEECETDADCPRGSTCCNCTCEGGGGPNPECTGATCGTFVPCNPGTTCPGPVCATTAEGGGVCLEGSTGCAGLAPCVTTADCADGVCAVETCCGTPVCVPTAAFCPAPATAGAPVGECFKADVCSGPEVCTTCDGCNGACFFTAEGPTKCFFGEYFCSDFPQACAADSDCPAGSACANSCCGATCVPLCGTPPPPVDECFKEAPCAAAEVCTDESGCNGACFFNAAGNTKCFAGEYFCGTNPTCNTDADCAPGFGCSDTCCGHECAPLCGGAAAAAAGSSSVAPAAAAVPTGSTLGKPNVPTANSGSSSN